MPLRLDCDSCDFERETDDEVTAYAAARDHEAANPSHFVFIEETY
ncbi:MAG: hypothetical protein V5A44_06430 [Haloarculaceae archaeon]